MKIHGHEHSNERLGKALCVSASGFYRWKSGKLSARAKRDRELTVEIRRIHEGNIRVYGSPRVHSELKKRKTLIGRKRVARLMREAGLRGACRRRKKPRTTNSDHDDPIAPNLAKEIEVKRPDELWVVDFTYIRTRTGWVYLACVMDALSRRIVGWNIERHMKTSLVEKALERALRGRGYPEGLTHHSDRGSQYASGDYRRALKRQKIKVSMSRRGNPYDNAKMESFFATLKCEGLREREYKDEEDVRQRCFAYIEPFYNHRRNHSSLGGLSPEEFEERGIFSNPAGLEKLKPTASLLDNQDQEPILN